MRSTTRLNWLGIFSAISLIGGVLLLVIQLVLYSRSFSSLPGGLSLGGVPVGGLSEQQAQEQLILVYTSPIELLYQDQRIRLDPARVSFQLDTGLMLPEVNQFRLNDDFWSGFWDFLWLKPGQANDIPLRSSYSPERLRAFLEDVAARYDRPGSDPQADVGTLGFQTGAPGHVMDVDAAVSLVDAALHSPTERTITLPVAEQTAVRPTLGTLNELIYNDLGLFQFDGILSLFLTDLKTGRELVINAQNQVPVQGPIAFSGMSTIKVAIMVSYFVHNGDVVTPEQSTMLARSIEQSDNTATDQIMTVIGQGDGYEGTRRITADMQRLGLANTYISGLLDTLGAVLLPISTPANSRTDINTLPDPYNQTSVEDMGALTVMIYQCSQGGGALIAAFPGAVTPQECRQMIDLLTTNLVGPIFITGGSTPDGVVAHKHGWDSTPLNNAADTALVFTPTNSYALTIFVHTDNTIPFDDANRLIISVSRAVYNYFNWGTEPAASQ